MTEDRSYIDAITRERERLRALLEGLDADSLSAAVNEYWTVAGVLGHVAYWDIRPLIHAIAPPEAARLALRTAEECDALVADLPLDPMWPGDPESPINARRWEHRADTSMRSRLPSEPAADPSVMCGTMAALPPRNLE